MKYKTALNTVFIILICIIIGLGANYLFFKPDKTISIKFNELGPVYNNLSVYYRGLKVGKVKGTGYSKDFKNTVLTVDIYWKKLDLPGNTYAELRIEDKTNQKYLALVYPKNPDDNILKNGSEIEGKPAKQSQINDMLIGSINQEEVKSAVGNIMDATANATKIGNDVSKITEMLAEMLEKNRQKIDKIIEESSAATENINTASAAIKVDVPKISDDFNRTINRYDCIGVGLSDMLGKRFLIPRLFFGKTGGGFDSCTGEEL